MRLDNTTQPNFGTKLRIGDSQQTKLQTQSKKFLNGIILAATDLERNGIDDELVLQLGRKNFQGTGAPLADAFAYNDPKKMDQLTFTWLAPQGNEKRNIKEKKVNLKKINNKSPLQIKAYILATLNRFQPQSLRAKATKPEKLKVKEVIELADNLAQMTIDNMRLAAAQKPKTKSSIEGLDEGIQQAKELLKQAGIKLPKPSTRKNPTQRQLKAFYLIDKYGYDDFGGV